MSEEAETKCESCLSKATELDPTNADAFHLFASFWMSKEDKEVDIKSIFRSFGHVLKSPIIRHLYTLYICISEGNHSRDLISDA